MMFRSKSTDSEVARAVAAVVADAVAQAREAATFMAHIAECKEDKAEIKRTLVEQNADTKRMHAENSGRFEQINHRINEIAWAVIWRMVIAMAVMVCASFGALYAILVHRIGLF